MHADLLEIDGGQTGIKLRWLGDTQRQEYLLPGVQTHRPVLPQLAEAIDHATRRAGRNFEAIAIGTTGLIKAEHDAGKLADLLAPGVSQKIYLAHDSVSSYLGALGDARGAVVAAGTGVVTLGVGPDAVARVDGWGHIMGDAGSGYWIGAAALRAVMRAYDGRGPATALNEPVRQHWPDLEEAYIDLQSSADRVAIVASFCGVVGELAPSDAVAATICADAGHELARSVETALRRTAGASAEDRAQVAAIGGVFNSEHVRTAFAQELGRRVPRADLVQARGNGLDGIARMAALPAGHALHQLISHTVRH